MLCVCVCMHVCGWLWVHVVFVCRSVCVVWGLLWNLILHVHRTGQDWGIATAWEHGNLQTCFWHCGQALPVNGKKCVCVYYANGWIWCPLEWLIDLLLLSCLIQAGCSCVTSSYFDLKLPFSLMCVCIWIGCCEASPYVIYIYSHQSLQARLNITHCNR